MKKQIGFKSGPWKTNDISYSFAAPMGVPGDITRTDESNVEPAVLITPFPSNYGVAMKYTTGGITPFASADTASLVAGLLARAVPGISQSNTAEAVDTFQPNQSEPQGLMVRGYMCVKVNANNATAPARGASVYICNTAVTGWLVGDFGGDSNSGNNVALTGTKVGNITWAQDGVDPNGFAEIRVAQ